MAGIEPQSFLPQIILFYIIQFNCIPMPSRSGQKTQINNKNNIILKSIAKMKPTTIKTPALEQIYNQRHQYEQHKQKLMKIYKDRKSQLGYDTNRVSSFQHIKDFKSKSFIHKFNEQNSVIAKENQRLFGKLESVKTSLRNSVSEERNRSTSYITPFIKSRLVQTEKQNLRISNRMKNMSSSLNQKNFVKDYAKSQKIKNRLMKYTAEDSRVVLKSERYFNQNQENQSVLSHSKDKSIKDKELSEGKNISLRPSYRKSAISHYRREDILKNKIDTATSSLAGIKAQANRPNTSIEMEKVDENNEGQFFTTQPNRQRKIGSKKVYM